MSMKEWKRFTRTANTAMLRKFGDRIRNLVDYERNGMGESQ